MLLFDVVQGGLDRGGGGHVWVDTGLAARPQGDAAAGFEHAGGSWPEAGHVEPVRGVGGGDEIDAGVWDGG